tara:strand:+ start:58 stop:285 length:228 start_codon:yes stop_codon:yes gene_type:complete
MTIKSIKINKNNYKYYSPDSYIDYKLLLKQKIRIEQKIKACQPGGCYYGIVCKNGLPRYNDYPELLAFLETLLDN